LVGTGVLINLEGIVATPTLYHTMSEY
jgi:hypothetical protein